MGSTEYALLIDFVSAITAALVLVPLLLYLFGDWTTRRDKLFGYFGKESLTLYYDQFYPAKTPSKDQVEAEFKRDFARNYGRRRYAVPIALLSILTFWSAYAGARTLQVSQKVAIGKYSLPWITASAIAGGFVWVINDLISRIRRRDLVSSDINMWTFRILIAAPFGGAFAQLVKEDIGIPIAFLLGAFPTGTLFTIARRLAATRLGLSDDPSSGTLELEKLQSVTKTNAERFYDEGISTIVQLAYANPVDLTIRTNFDFNYVVDCISQALLWLYFEDKTRTLAIYSLRGAQEVSALMQWVKLGQAEAIATLNAVATALNLSPAALQTTLVQVANDPYTKFICAIWD
jgi:hypothetical protein